MKKILILAVALALPLYAQTTNTLTSTNAIISTNSSGALVIPQPAKPVLLRPFKLITVPLTAAQASVTPASILVAIPTGWTEMPNTRSVIRQSNGSGTLVLRLQPSAPVTTQ